MNLYEIRFIHYAPKDSETGILTYLCAENDEAVYEWIASDPSFGTGKSQWICSGWHYREGDEEGFKDRVIECCGNMYDDETELCDLYYGQTLYGWGLVKNNVSVDEIKMLNEIGIRVKFA